MSVTIYIEGGGNSKSLKTEMSIGFTKLLENCGLRGRMPRLVRGGGRKQTYDKFKTAFENALHGDLILLLVDSEDPVSDVNRTWEHLRRRQDDQWKKPDGAKDEDVLLMATCMETWIVADRAALHEHFGSRLRESALPSLYDLENRNRHDVQDRLESATRECPGPYAKGKRSFIVLGKLNPEVLQEHLPSFCRARRILNNVLRRNRR